MLVKGMNLRSNLCAASFLMCFSFISDFVSACPEPVKSPYIKKNGQNVDGQTFYVEYELNKTLGYYRAKLGISATGAMDNDVRMYGEQRTEPADSVTQTWLNDDIAVSTVGNYVCRSKWDDAAIIPTGETGGRKDGPLYKEVYLSIQTKPDCTWVNHSEEYLQGSIGWNLQNIHHFSFTAGGAPFGLGMTAGEIIDINITRTLWDTNRKVLYNSFAPYYTDHVSSMSIYETTAPPCSGHDGLCAIDDDYTIEAVAPATWFDQEANQQAGSYPLDWFVYCRYDQDIWLSDQSQILRNFSKLGTAGYTISKDGQGNITASSPHGMVLP